MFYWSVCSTGACVLLERVFYWSVCSTGACVLLERVFNWSVCFTGACVLQLRDVEHPRTIPWGLRLLPPTRRRGVPASGPETGVAGDIATWTLHMCRVGICNHI